MIEIIGTVLGALLTKGIFKAPAYWLFQRSKSGVWLCLNCPNGNSARRCKKARKVLLDSGIPPGDIMILPKGTTPPKEG